MSLDVAVQVSQIAIPFLIVIVGYFISGRLNSQHSSLERQVFVRKKSAEMFYQKALKHVNDISEFCTLLQAQGFYPKEEKLFIVSLTNIMMRLISSARDVELYKELSENTEEVFKAVKLAEPEWRDLFESLKTRLGSRDFKKLFECQKQIIKELVEFQKSEILGPTP